MQTGLPQERIEELRALHRSKYAGLSDAEIEAAERHLSTVSIEALSVELRARGFKVESR